MTIETVYDNSAAKKGTREKIYKGIVRGHGGKEEEQRSAGEKRRKQNKNNNY